MPTCPACGQNNPDGARFCLACAAALTAPEPERRRLATLVFCDVTGSTALGERSDPEIVREVMFRYFHEMRSAIERHGGTVEKFAGDAVMAAFGIPEAHEDDALRACRAALEMQERVAVLAPELERRFGVRLQTRIGVNTGEVVAGAGADTFATGDAVNVAARLEQAAQPGDVLVGESTLALVRNAVELEPVPRVQAKGKSEPVRAFRLRSVAARAPAHRDLPALVGRDDELQLLLSAFGEVVRERRSRLVTVVGEAGVGKSRLVGQFESDVSGRVLTGRCLSYGEGITFWPLAEIVRAAAVIHDEDPAEEARAKVASLAEPAVAGRIAALVGLGGRVTPEDVGWVVRRFVGALAAERPLLLVVEDVHWAEPTLLDLLLELSHVEAPVLVLATARPELLEGRPEWPGVVPLDPLGAEETRHLLAELLENEPDAALVARAGGNPLFVHELAALLRQGGDATALPSSLSALLAARLDRLPVPERDAVERASVEGEVFHRGALATLLGTDPRAAGERVAVLVERDFVFPAEARFVDEAAFRFRHVLVREAAYSGLVKRLRAQLHELYADWLERKVGDRLAEVEEIVGYHLEQAARYADELGLEARALAERAAERLYAAGRRHGRADVPGALSLLGRAVDLTPPDSAVRAERLLGQAVVLFAAGEIEAADAAFAEAEELAAESGDERIAAYARLDWRRSNVDREELVRSGKAAIRVFEAASDDLGLSKAWGALADYHHGGGQFAASQEAFERSLFHARRAGDADHEAIVLARLSGGLRFGPYSVDEAISRMERELADPGMALHPRAVWTAFLGLLEARRGNVERSRDLCRDARGLIEETGDVIASFWVADACMETELLAGDHAAAERLARENVERTERIGDVWPEAGRCGLARVLLDQRRFEEAGTVVDRLEQEDAWTDLFRAAVLARRDDAEEAERLARAAVDFLEETDARPSQGEAYRVLADVLRCLGRRDEALQALEQALEIEERLGATLLVERTRALIADLA